MAGFELGDVKVVGQKSTLSRDTFVNLLKTKAGFFQLENQSSSYLSFRFKQNDWLFVRAYSSYYQIHLMGDYDSYVVKKHDYDALSQQPEGFMMNNILKGI